MSALSLTDFKSITDGWTVGLKHLSLGSSGFCSLISGSFHLWIPSSGFRRVPWREKNCPRAWSLHSEGGTESNTTSEGLRQHFPPRELMSKNGADGMASLQSQGGRGASTVGSFYQGLWLPSLVNGHQLSQGTLSFLPWWMDTSLVRGPFHWVRDCGNTLTYFTCTQQSSSGMKVVLLKFTWSCLPWIHEETR